MPSAISARLSPPPSYYKTIVPLASPLPASTEKCSTPPALGELPATGGPQLPGIARNGTLLYPPPSTASTANPTSIGSLKAPMTSPPPTSNHPLPYIELHTRSAFSFLEGSSVPEELIARAAELDFPALAILDADNISGAARFHMAAKKAGLRAHIGAEITCTDGFRYPLLAENRKGYQNLCRLITRMKMRAKKGEGAANPEEFSEFADGLVCLASCPDPRFLDQFGAKNIFVELQRHYNRTEEALNQSL